MTFAKKTNLVLSTLLLGGTLSMLGAAQAQPMMGDTGGEHARMHSRMEQHWEKRQSELKPKLHLTPAQEGAWTAFVQAMKPPAKPAVQPLDRNELAKLSTPERLDKMNATHEAHLKDREAHLKQRTEATRTFYNQLSAEQKKVFDTETLRDHGPRKGGYDKRD